MSLFKKKEKDKDVKYMITGPVTVHDVDIDAHVTILKNGEATSATLTLSKVFVNSILETFHKEKTDLKKSTVEQRKREFQIKVRRDNNIGHKFLNVLTCCEYTLCGIATHVSQTDQRIRGSRPISYYYVDSTSTLDIYSITTVNGETQYLYTFGESSLPVYLVMEDKGTTIELISTDDFYEKRGNRFVYKRKD